ncbi:MAG: TolC family protein [Pseudomonadota bacterium]|nr:TolC family protein [Pseudomonadota bacterium]
MRYPCLLLLLGTLAPGAVPAQPLPLPEVLSQIKDGPGVQALLAESELARGQAQLNQDEAGWSLFGSANVGRFRELDAGVGRVDYTGYGASVGLSHPLLGTLNERLNAVAESTRDAELTEAQANLARDQQRLSVRMAYADWWQSQQQQALCERHRQLAGVEREAINTRHQARQLRDSDQLWLTRGWAQHLRPCDTTIHTERQARQRLAERAGVTISARRIALWEALPTPDAVPDLRQAVLDGHPVLNQRQSHWQQAQADDPNWYDPIDARVSISQQLDQRSDIPGTGTGLVAAFSFEVPLGSLGERRNTQRLEEQTRKYQWLDARAAVGEQITDALSTYQVAYRQWQDAQDDTALARQRAWEQQQRVSVDANGFLALRTAVLALAEAEAAELAARGNAWRARAELALLQSLAGPELASAKARAHAPAGDWSRAVYVWDSTELLNGSTRTAAITELTSARFDTVYLGLSADQLRADDLNRQLTALVNAMREQGLSVYLLLGEPTWIQPEQRRDLITLIQTLAAVPFDGLHLDLEVEQLGWPVPEATVGHWLDTLEAASRASPWPVSIVAHHRWFSDPDFRSPECVPCQLPGLGIRDASIMAYSTAGERLDQIVAQATALSPGLNLGVVQSLEPVLPDTNSWYGRPPGQIEQLESGWRQQWQSFGIGLLAWQDWASYQENARRAPSSTTGPSAESP